MGYSDQTITSVPMRLASGPSSIATIAKICTSTVWRRRMRRSSFKKEQRPFRTKMRRVDNLKARRVWLTRFRPRPSKTKRIFPDPSILSGTPSKDGFPPTFVKVNDQSSEFLKKIFYLSIGSVALSKVLYLALVAFW